MPSLSWKHQSLIQALLTRGPLKENDFHEIFSAVTGKSPGFLLELFWYFRNMVRFDLFSLRESA